MDYSRDGTDTGKYSREEIQKIIQTGKISIAYINIGEAEDHRFYWRDEWYSNPPKWLGDKDPERKGCYAVKYWYKEWKNIIFKYLDKIIQQGFSGVYLDKIDEFEYWAKNGYDEEFTAREMINLIIEISNHCKGKDFLIILQNGEKLIEYDNVTLLSIIYGWVVEDLFYNGTKKKTREEIDKRIKLLD